jgi:hypothetical protein
MELEMYSIIICPAPPPMKGRAHDGFGQIKFTLYQKYTMPKAIVESSEGPVGNLPAAR